jgi:hypothetical protein
VAGVDPRVLARFIRDTGLKYSQNKRSYVFNCPRCGSKKKLYMEKTGGKYICFKCSEINNYRGRPEFALADLSGLHIREVQSRLYGGDFIPVTVHLAFNLIDYFDDEDELDEDAHLIPTLSMPLDYYPIEDPASVKGANYLRGRGLSVALARRYGLHYSPERKRVVFPVADGKDLYGWQERYIGDTHYVDEEGNDKEILKIVSSPRIPRERTLMFVDRLKGLDHAVLCEGPVDAMKAHFCGGNVCAMGKAVTREQFNLLLNGGVKKIYLALDPDAASEMRRITEEYNDYVQLYDMRAPSSGADKIDLGAMTHEEVYDLFMNAPLVKPPKLFFYLKR